MLINHLAKIKHPMIALIFIILTFILARLVGITINDTSSMREGIYINTTGRLYRGDTVALCLTEPYKTIGLNNFYIEKGQKCKGTIPLIKKIIAVPGDDIILTDDYIRVNGQKYNYKTLRIDSLGRALKVYPRGNYQKTNGFWMIGTNSLNSWDSRYWGPIAKKQILHKIKPLWVW